jgi:hypothetical protein
VTLSTGFAQALRDLINEAVQAAVERDRPTPPLARVVERPKVFMVGSHLRYHASCASTVVAKRSVSVPTFCPQLPTKMGDPV